MKAYYESVDLGNGKVITLETGRLAKQAQGSVVVRQGDTMVLCTACVGTPREGLNFFPLTVDYREQYAAGGKIPGGFFKREGRPSEKEILSSRLIDRCIRPLFPDGYFNEIQLMSSVISSDGQNDADVVAGVGSSAALFLTGAPFGGPIGEVRVGRIDGEFVINPTILERSQSDIDLVVAGTATAIMMVEGEMKEISEDEMVSAIECGHDVIKKLCAAQQSLLDQMEDTEVSEYELNLLPEGLEEKVTSLAGNALYEHLKKPYNKKDFYQGIADIKESVLSALLGDTDPEAGTERAEETEEGWTSGQIKEAVGAVEKTVMREMILAEGKRLDGRTLTDIRDIWSETSYLPRSHGSAIFTRGETQVLASVTLGTVKDAQMIDDLFDEEDRKFFLHYNFPPYSTGEVRPIRGTSRRETGHGKLAERALANMLPDEIDFPYTIRVVGDVLESNGSSSMATVCSGCLALMDAGVPIKKPVAGIAMGLIKEGDRVAILSDILGTEDHLGDMDFKVTGTRDGITACQMDIKIDGLSRETLAKALDQAKAGRMHILDKMAETLEAPREELKPHAPRLTQLEISPDYIGAIIGSGGKVIQGIQKDTGTEINIEEKDGKAIVTIASTSGEAAAKAEEIIKLIITEPEVGEDYDGKVVSILEFGPLVEILPGKVGLLHVSEMSYNYISKVDEVISVGDEIKVRLLDILKDGKFKLSHLPFLEKPEGYDEEQARRRSQSRSGGGDRRGGSRDNRGGGRGGRNRGDRHDRDRRRD